MIEPLRQVANRWAMKARETAREAKEIAEKDAARSNYLRGLADGYYKAAVELAELLKQNVQTGILSTPAQTAPLVEAPAKPETPKPAYVSMSIGDVLNVLEYGGLTPRDVLPNDDGSFTGIFSKWESIMPHERLDRLKVVDKRIAILGSGKTKEGDPYIDFAFQEKLT